MLCLLLERGKSVLPTLWWCTLAVLSWLEKWGCHWLHLLGYCESSQHLASCQLGEVTIWRLSTSLDVIGSVWRDSTWLLSVVHLLFQSACHCVTNTCKYSTSNISVGTKLPEIIWVVEELPHSHEVEGYHHCIEEEPNASLAEDPKESMKSIKACEDHVDPYEPTMQCQVDRVQHCYVDYLSETH